MEKVRAQKGYYKIMKGHRFYEILEAHRKGEDLSVFIPTNSAEAELLANLAGGGSGGSSVLPHPLNNPSSKINYGQLVPAESHLYIDFPKLAEYIGKYTDYDVNAKLYKTTSGSGSGSGSSKFDEVYINLLYQIVIGSTFNDGKFRGISLYGDDSSVTMYYGWSDDSYVDEGGGEKAIATITDKEATFASICAQLGVVKTDKFKYAYEADLPKIIASIPIKINDIELDSPINLNEMPIDFMWFE